MHCSGILVLLVSPGCVEQMDTCLCACSIVFVWVFFPPVVLIGDTYVHSQLISRLIGNNSIPKAVDVVKYLFWNTMVDGKIIEAKIHSGTVK